MVINTDMSESAGGDADAVMQILRFQAEIRALRARLTLLGVPLLEQEAQVEKIAAKMVKKLLGR